MDPISHTTHTSPEHVGNYFLFGGHTVCAQRFPSPWLCTQECLVDSGEHVVLGIKSKLATYKASAFPTVAPRKFSHFSLYQPPPQPTHCRNRVMVFRLRIFRHHSGTHSSQGFSVGQMRGRGKIFFPSWSGRAGHREQRGDGVGTPPCPAPTSPLGNNKQCFLMQAKGQPPYPGSWPTFLLNRVPIQPI